MEHILSSNGKSLFSLNALITHDQDILTADLVPTQYDVCYYGPNTYMIRKLPKYTS